LEKLICDNNIDPEEYAILLVGNKTDKKNDPVAMKKIEEDKRRKMESEDYFDDEDLGIVDEQDAIDFCEENDLRLDPLFISATNGNDVAKVFNTLCEHIEYLKNS
jgi:GTPase SAR1 family protein